MTVRKLKAGATRLEALVAQDRDLLKALAKEALDQVLQAEMAEFLGTARGERSETRVYTPTPPMLDALELITPQVCKPQLPSSFFADALRRVRPC